VSSAKFIGTAGGVAVALGVGAAAFSGSAVAWADSPADSASHAQHSSPKAAASTSRVRPASTHAAVRTHTTKVDSPVAAAVAPAMTAATTGALGSLTSGPQVPVAPADSSLALALLADARRPMAAARGATATASSTTTPAPAAVVQAASTTTTALIMGPSGVPIPSQDYVTNVNKLYIQPNSPGATTQVVFTPEGLYPITGVKSLPLNTSVDQGLQIIDQTAHPLLSAGTPVIVFGYSQSAIISSLYQYAEAKLLPTPQNLSFVLVGNEMNPDGGFLSRFPGLKMPSLGIDFYGATPKDLFPTTNYTLEYDGFADFPRYPLNFLADLNAGLGIVFVHTKYADLTKAQVDQAIPLPTTDSTQKYYIIRTENLPLLDPLRLVPLIGKPLADLVQPALKVLVNLGYGDPAYGWSTGTDANVLTPFGVFPHVKFSVVLADLVAGVQQGIHDFLADISPGGLLSQELSSITRAPQGTYGSAGTPVINGITALQHLITTATDAITTATASLYAALLPTADIVNALVTTLPAYSVNLFLDGVKEVLAGQLLTGVVDAFGKPIAADVGLGTTAGLIEFLVIAQAIAGAIPASKGA